MDRTEAERLAIHVASKYGWRVDEITPPAGIGCDDLAPYHVVHARRQPDGQAFGLEFTFHKPADWARVRFQEVFA